MKIKKSLFLYIFLGCFICACVSAFAANTNTDKTADDSYTEETKDSFEPFYVYKDFKSSDNHYLPSGWMGDVKKINMDLACTDNTYEEGSHCIKLSYASDGSQKWAGIYWQNPENNWGNKKGGFDLTGAKKLTFYARGAQGYERISEVKIGGIGGEYPDTAKEELKRIKLSNKWKKYTIDLSKADLSYISGGFCIVFSSADNPKGCTIYLDEIRYE